MQTRHNISIKMTKTLYTDEGKPLLPPEEFCASFGVWVYNAPATANEVMHALKAALAEFEPDQTGHPWTINLESIPQTREDIRGR